MRETFQAQSVFRKIVLESLFVQVSHAQYKLARDTFLSMKTDLASYRKQRESLLTEIVEKLSSDERFVAGWLGGSYGRNDVDEVSDLDLSLIVAKPYTTALCTRAEQVSHRTTEERFELFSEFGSPALIHENNNNAPEGGTFTFVLYSESAIMVDWVLVPRAKATRPFQSSLLFDKVGIPISPPAEPEDLEQSRKSVAENWAFFWMMTAITIKYIIRGNGVFATQWIENLHRLIHEIERQMNREASTYTRGSLSTLQSTREKQLESILKLCNRMQELQPKVREFTNSEPITPLAEIETLFSLTKK